MSERTRRQAAIKRATQAAQRRMNALDRRTLDELERIYLQTRGDIEARIRAAANDAGLSAVYLSSHEAAHFRGPRRRLELVHNHRTSSSLSLPDLILTTLPGVERVVAVGHDGSVYAGRALVDRRALERVYRKVSERLIRRLRAMVTAGDLDADNRVWSYALNTGLARAGQIEYTLERSGDLVGPALGKVDLNALVSDLMEDLR